jgi:long-chain fatty acid transport protein
MKDLTFTFDLQWTNWDKVQSLTVKLLDPAWNAAGVSENVLTLNWLNQLQVRFGLEYVMGNFAVRAGYYYDPHPAPDSTMNILIPSFTYNSITAGVGYRMGSLRFDFGLEYLMGKDRTIAPAPDNMPGLYDMNILVPMISFSTGW